MKKILDKIRRVIRLWNYDEMGDVLAFYQKFGQPALARPSMPATPTRMEERIRFMQEELDEFKEALAAANMELMADALIDLVYVVKGTALELGLPWEELWLDVQRANMAKVIGTTHRGIAMDVKKPPGWVPPKTFEILMAAGYYDHD